jgi:hypothetical protein
LGYILRQPGPSHPEEQFMMRRYLTIAAAVAVPTSLLALAGPTGVAGAAGLPPTVTCAIGGTTTFPFGLSLNGDTTAPQKKSAYTISTSAVSATGCGASNTAVSLSTTAIGTTTTTVGKKTEYVPGTFADKTASGATNPDPKGFKVEDGSKTYTLVPKTTTEEKGAACLSGTTFEIGSEVTGTIKKGGTFTLLICEDTDTGTDTSTSDTTIAGDQFTPLIYDAAKGAGGNPLFPGGGDPAIDIASGHIDPTLSYLTINS